MATPKDSYTLLGDWISLWELKYGKKPVVNRYREKWGMGDVIDSLGLVRAREVLKAYFEVPGVEPSFSQFYIKFDEIDENMKAVEKDKLRTEKLRKESAARAAEWRAQNERRSKPNSSSLPA